jgi:hypothetical protein
VALLTWGVIVIEALLAAGLLASKPARKLLLSAGIALHLAILVFQGLFSFSITMFGALILFLRPVEDLFELHHVLHPLRAKVDLLMRRSLVTPGPSRDISTG